MTNDLIIPSREDFEAWLRSKNPAEIVGYASDGDNCPIARWLNEATGLPLSVGVGIIIQGTTCKAAAEPWLSDFVEAVDSDSTNDQLECEAQWCLSILEERKGCDFSA